VEESKITIPTSTSDTIIEAPKKNLQLKRYMKPLLVYGITIFSNAALSFATFALLTHHLTEVDYGIINLYNSFIILLMPFISIGVPFVLNVDYFKMNKEGFSKQFTNALVIPLISCFLFTLVSLIFHTYIEQVTKANYFFVIIAAFSCLLVLLNDVILNLLRNKEKYFLFAGFSLGKNLIEVSLTILFVIGLGYNWVGRLTSNFIMLLVTGGIILLLARNWQLFKSAIDKKTIAAVLIAGLPFIPERLALFTIGYSDRFFIDHFSGTADVGYYGAGAQLAMIVNLSILTLNNTFYPKLFKGLSNSTLEKKEISRLILMYLGISALITLSVIGIVPVFFRYFIGPNFQPGKAYAIYLSIGFFFWSIYNVFVAFLLNLRRNKLIMQISIFGMLLSLVSNFFNVKRFGALGATYTSMIVYFSMAFITIYFVNRYYNLKKIFK
jgi:O-antigen/teichoic acid export membrane protein